MVRVASENEIELTRFARSLSHTRAYSTETDQAVFAYVRDDKIGELWEIVDMASLRGQLGEPSWGPANMRSQLTATA